VSPGTLSRRSFLGATAGAGALLAAGAGAASAGTVASPGPSVLPRPDLSGIDHIVVLMMENRSFDHFLGWLPGADGRQAGLVYRDKLGLPHATHHLTTFQGCGKLDPDHSYAGGRTQFHGGACDGWLRAASDDFAIGYYQPQDLAFYRNAAPYWTVCDRSFAATMGPTYPNRFYLHSAQTDRQDDSMTTTGMPTIWDRLRAKGVSGRYFFSDIPFTALYGPRHLDISRPMAEFILAARTGTLPAVSFLDPRFLGEDGGVSGDDHPHSDIRVGQRFVSDVYQAVTTSPNWSRTMLVVTYDEWGGFFDHVAPTTAPDTNPANALRGFRIPTFVISPRARRHHVAHETYDHTSILAAIEWRFGLDPLTPRDAAARNIAEVLDFSRPPDTTAPQWFVPNQLGFPCLPGLLTDHQQGWRSLGRLAARLGFDVPAGV
jgi:phospholipase C